MSAKVQISLRPVQRLIQVGIALRAILGKSRQLGQHAVLPLPEAEPFPIRQTLTAIRLGQHVVLSLPEAEGGTDVDRPTDATQSRPYLDTM